MDIGAATQTRQTTQIATPENASDMPEPVISSDFETFLKMLSTQLQNQDPLNPVDSADYASQLATFSSVEQQVLTNNHLQRLSDQIGLAGLSDLAGWVGMEVQSFAMSQYDGTGITFATAPRSAADAAVLVVRNEAGDVVFRDDLPLTREDYTWSGETATGGTAPEGLYYFEVESSAKDEVIATDPVATYADVTEARRLGDDTVLVLEGGVMVSASDVMALRQPG